MLGGHSPLCKIRNTTLFPYAARTYSQIGKQVGKAQKKESTTAEKYILVNVLLEMVDKQAETLRHQTVRNSNKISLNTHKSLSEEEPKLAVLSLSESSDSLDFVKKKQKTVLHRLAVN